MQKNPNSSGGQGKPHCLPSKADGGLLTQEKFCLTTGGETDGPKDHWAEQKTEGAKKTIRFVIVGEPR